jgi:hypothetical protein
MKGTVALIALGVAGVGAGLFIWSRRAKAAGSAGPLDFLGLGGGASSGAETSTAVATTPIPAAGASSSQRYANILANKTGTKVVCGVVSQIYTSGAATGACGAVADVANKVTELQIRATQAVASKVAPVASGAWSAVRTSVVVPTKAAITVTKAAVAAPVQAAKAVGNFVGSLW